MAPTRSTRSSQKATNSELVVDQRIVQGPRIRKETSRFVEFKQSLKKPSKQNSKQDSKQDRKTSNDAGVDKLMIRLYAEIHAAAVDKIDQKDRIAVRDLLRQTRTLRFLDLYPKQAADRLKKTLTDFQPSNNHGKKVVQRALEDLEVSHPERLVSFSKNPNLVVLSICAHSETFRNAIARSDADSKTEGEPLWRDIRSKVDKCASSLELFAKTRNLDWNSAVKPHNKDYQYLLSSVFHGDNNIAGVDSQTFGIGDRDLKETHHPDDNVPSHWMLPPRRTKAKRPQFEYTYTEVLDNHNFFGSGVPGNLNGAERPEIGASQVAFQVNMDESTVVRGYDWSHLPPEAQGDPRFAGYKGHPCSACGKEPKTASTGSRASARTACSCTIVDLCSQRGGVANPLIEIFDTRTTGAGVRALQPFKKGDYLGEYIGEIYPRQENDDSARYGPGEGGMYLFPVEIAREDASSLQAGGRSTKRKKALPMLKKKRRAKKGAIGQNGPKDKYNIDPAIFGNWTRYINHSCDPNTEYVKATVGQRKAIVIRVQKEIGFGEELTADYGPNYFENLGLTCRCGSEKCGFLQA